MLTHELRILHSSTGEAAFDATFLTFPGTSFSFFTIASSDASASSLIRCVEKCFRSYAIEAHCIDRETINTKLQSFLLSFVFFPFFLDTFSEQSTNSMARVLPLDMMIKITTFVTCHRECTCENTRARKNFYHPRTRLASLSSNVFLFNLLQLRI